MTSSEISTTKTISPPEYQAMGVLICAASSLVRTRLERRLETEPGIEVLGSLAALTDFTSSNPRRRPEALLIHAATDTRMTAQLSLLQTLRIPSVLLVDEISAGFVADAMSQGVSGLLPSHSSGREMTAALRAVATGLTVIGREFTAVIYDAIRNQPPSRTETHSASAIELTEALTPREHEILQMLIEGLSNKEIALQLDVSVHTVKFHISSILGKLGAASRTQATTIGLRRGLITI